VSLILEALKKSEAERRLGKAPELLSPAPVARRRHGLWPLAAAMLLAVALSTGITWWLLRPAPSPANGEVAAPAGDAAPAAAGPAPASTTVAAEAPATPATEATPPPAPATGTAGQMPRPPVERESAPMVAGNTPPPQPRPEAIATRDAATAAPSAAADATPARPSAPAPAPAATTAAEPADPPPPDEPAVPPLHALPRDVQAALPPLKLSMHVYKADPGQRFVLIDGRRYGEGMTVAEGLLIEAIRRDGVVLAFRGHRFLLPRPG